MHLAKPHPLFLAIPIDGKLVVAVQMADIEGFSAPCCMAAEDTEQGQGRLLKEGQIRTGDVSFLCVQISDLLLY